MKNNYNISFVYSVNRNHYSIVTKNIIKILKLVPEIMYLIWLKIL